MFDAQKGMKTERGGFDLARFLNLCRCLSLSPNLRSDNDFARLADVLFLDGVLPSRDAYGWQFEGSCFPITTSILGRKR